MAPRIQEYHRPTDWPAAHRLLARTDLRIAPLFLSPRPQAPEDWPADAVVDLSKLGLGEITADDSTIKIGMLASLQSLVESDVLKSSYNGILSRCADLAGTLGLRHYASLGGLLSDPNAAPETALALLALDAQVLVRTHPGGERSVSIADFLAGKAGLQPGDVPCEVHISRRLPGIAVLERVARTPRDLAIVAVVARVAVQNGLVSEVRLALSGAAPAACRFEAVESLLVGQPLQSASLEKAASAAVETAVPLSDMRGSAEYRQAMAGLLVRRALLAAQS